MYPSSESAIISTDPIALIISSTLSASRSQWAGSSRTGMCSEQMGHCLVSARLAYSEFNDEPCGAKKGPRNKAYISSLKVVLTVDIRLGEFLDVRVSFLYEPVKLRFSRFDEKGAHFDELSKVISAEFS